jgi:PAS domain S-box-containing protein
MRADPKPAPTPLLDAEERLRLISGAARLGVWEWDMGEVVTWSASMEELYGFEPGGFPGTFDAFLERVHPEDHDLLFASVNAAIERDEPMDFEHRVILPDGGVRWLNGRGTVIRDGTGAAVRMLGVGIDIDDRKRAELALAATRDEQRIIADTIPAIICTADATGRITYYNERWYEYTGFAIGADLSDEEVISVFHEDERDTVIALWHEALQTTHAPYTVDYRLRRADGEHRWHIGHVSPVRDEAGEVTSWVSSSVDIHDARMAADAMAESEARYRTLAELMPAMITVHDANGTFVYSNRQVLEYSGISLEDLRAGNWMSLFHPDDLEAHLDDWVKGLQNGEQIEGEFRARRHDGVYRWHLGRVCPVRDSEGTIVRWIAAHIDIHERKQAEEARREIDRRYHALEQSSSVFIYLASPDGALTYTSQQFFEYTGVPQDVLEGEGWQFTGVVHPDDLPRTVEHWSRCVASGDPFEMEVRLRGADGEYRWHLNRLSPLRDDTGEIIEWVGVSTNIEQLRRTEDELRRANAAKDEFLGLVSHELRTPITTILGNAEVLQRRYDAIDEDMRTTALADIRGEAERLHRIIDNLLVLARLERGQQVEREPLLVRRFVERIVAEQRRRAPGREIKIDVRIDATPVVAAPDYVEQVLRNLLSNAEKYSPAGAPIDIEIDQAGNELRVAVHDRGIGVPEGEIDRIFTPFYRSPRAADRAHGVGIGLAVCKRLIEAQGGRVWAERRDGGGSTFAFSLPIAAE